MQMARFHFFWWLNSIPLYIYIHIYKYHSFVDGHPCSFHSLAIVDITAINIWCTCPFGSYTVFFTSIRTPGSFIYLFTHINRWSNTTFFDVQMYYNVLPLNTMLTALFHCLTKSSSSLCHLMRKNIWTQSSLHIREWRLHPSVCAGKINVDVCPAHTPSCSPEYSPSKYIHNENHTSPLLLPPSMLKTPSYVPELLTWLITPLPHKLHSFLPANLFWYSNLT